MVIDLIRYKLVQKKKKRKEKNALKYDQTIITKTHEHVICAIRSGKT